MKASWKLGRIAGIDLFLHPTFLLLLAWIAMQGGMANVLLATAVFGCVVLHEFGHALTARLFGISTRDITIYPIGGVARLERMPRAPGAELLITLAGPAVNVAIAMVLGLSLWVDGYWQPWAAASFAGEFIDTLMQVNVFLAVFNMLPAFPMDGGRVLRSLLSAPLGRLRATEVAAGTGRALAILIPAGEFLLTGSPVFMHVLLAAFVFWAAGAELAQVRAEEARRRGGSDTGVWTAPPGYRWVRRGERAWQLSPIVMTAEPHRWP